MRRTLLVLVVGLAAPGVVAQGPLEFSGTFEQELVPGRPATSIRLTEVNADGRAPVRAVVAPDSKVYAGDVAWRKAAPLHVFLEEGPGNSRAILADLDGDGAISAAERTVLTQSNATSSPALRSAFGNGGVSALLRVPVKGAAFETYPVILGLNPASVNGPPLQSPQGAQRYLTISYQVFARSTVTVDGHAVLIQMIVNPDDLMLHTEKSYQYVDCNGDGAFDEDFTSWEMGYARGEAPVFHIGSGDRYVSIAKADLATRQIVLAARAASDYQRIELRLGSTLPDFEFVTLDGKPSRLSDFRGKHLLIDFWGTWCGPCVGEIPFLKKAYAAHKDQGFEILGMDNELPDVTAEDFAKGLDKVKSFVAKEGVTWTQARTESIKPLYEKRFQIVAWPTIILLDPEGKILSVDRVSRGEPGLRGDRLDATLQKILPKK